VLTLHAPTGALAMPQGISVTSVCSCKIFHGWPHRKVLTLPVRKVVAVRKDRHAEGAYCVQTRLAKRSLVNSFIDTTFPAVKFSARFLEFFRQSQSSKLIYGQSKEIE
jgi:hypothetical protein